MRLAAKVFLPTVLLIPALLPTASKGQTETIVGYHRLLIDNDARAIREIERRASMEKKRLEGRIGWLKLQRQEVDRLIGEALANHQIRLDKLASAAGWVRAHATKPDHRLHTPVGFYSPNTIAAAQHSETDAINNARAAMAAGTYKVHLSTLGWTSGDRVDAMLLQTRQQRDTLVRAVRDGTLRLKLIGLGRVDGKGLRKRMADNHKAIGDVLQSIEAGTYRLSGVPFLGRLTRIEIEKRSAGFQQEADKLEKSYNDRQLWIERHLIGSLTREKLEAQIAALSKEVTKRRDTHGKNMWNMSFPAYGWITGAQIRKKMKGIDDAVADIRARSAKGEYSAPVPSYGWTTENSVRAKIVALAGRSDARSRKSLAVNQAALPKIKAYAALHIAALRADLSTYGRILALYPRVLGEWQAMKKLEIAERVAFRNEFERDLKDRTRQIEAYQDWLAQAIAAFLPE